MFFNLALQFTTPHSTLKRQRQLKCSRPPFIQIYLQLLQPCTIIKFLCRHSSNSSSNKLGLMVVVVIHQMLVQLFSLRHLYFSSNNNRCRIPVPLLQLASVEALLLPSSSESLCMFVFSMCNKCIYLYINIIVLLVSIIYTLHFLKR